MSDETTPGPDVLALIRRAIADPGSILPRENDETVANWGARAALASVVQPELDRRDAEIKRLKAMLGPVLDEPCGNTEPADGRLTCTLPARHDVHYAAGSGTAWRCLCGPTDAEAAVARVKALAEDMRTWCSPYGIAANYAQRIEEAIEPPEPVGIDADSEAEFAAIIVATLRRHRAEVHPEHDDACGNCAVIKGAPELLTAGLDDLPAVREFVADFDPRQEG